jgi:hydroxymethylpyrimidine/phosphomethylpyrimidine kinase
VPAVPNVLTIAGSDSGGGAGVQADLKTIAALGGYGMSVITALTAQNGLGVEAIHAPPAEFAVAQLKAVRAGFPIHAAKTGMLCNAAIIAALAAALADKSFPLVVDPVSVSQSGHRLLEKQALAALVSKILPLADLLTPNKPEAEIFARMVIENEDDIAVAIARLLDMGPAAVLLKGGHFCEAGMRSTRGASISHSIVPCVIDWLGLPGKPPLPLPQPRVRTANTHGTGCTLSAAIALGLGCGLGLEPAIRQAQEYLNRCLQQSYAPGQGFGPPNHMAAFCPLQGPRV